MGYTCVRSSGLLKTRLIAAFLATALMALPASAVQYACAMSGEVSSSCCCAPKADEGSTVITRVCSCCDISVADQKMPARTAAIDVPLIAQPAVVSLLTPIAIDAPRLPLVGFVARSSPAPIYILNSTLLC